MILVRPSQVWRSDITSIRLAHGFADLVAVVDWYSRRVLCWRVSNTLEAGFCVDCLEAALRRHGKPEIFHTDQGSQCTSDAFTGALGNYCIVPRVSVTFGVAGLLEGLNKNKNLSDIADSTVCLSLVACRVKGELADAIQQVP